MYVLAVLALLILPTACVLAVLALLILLIQRLKSSISDASERFHAWGGPRGAANPWLGSFRCHSHSQRPTPVHKHALPRRDMLQMALAAGPTRDTPHVFKRKGTLTRVARCARPAVMQRTALRRCGAV